MKMKSILLSLSIALGATIASARPASLQVTLSIDPTTTLPGLSVPLYLHLENGPAAVHLGTGVRVRATSPDGQSFLTNWGHGNVDSGELELGLIEADDDNPVFTLTANGSVDLEIPALDLSRPSWALDGRMFTLPGDWKLQVLVHSDDATQPIATSNPVTLTIKMPTGNDVAIWQAIQRGELPGIGDKTFRENPQSEYFPYLATSVTRVSVMERIAIINRAIELHPSSPVVDALRYAVAMSYEMESGRVFSVEHDIDKASALADQGRAILTSLSKGKDTWGKLKGKAQLENFNSRDTFVELQRLAVEHGNPKP